MEQMTPGQFNLLTSVSGIGNKKILKMEYIRTPDVIWQQLEAEFSFSVDACASHKNHLVPRYWTKETNALEQNWDNEVVYCHPMYDREIPKFIKKAFQHNCLTVFLLPASTNAVYFHEHLWDNASHRARENVEIRFIPKAKGPYGYKFNTDDNEEPKTGYLRPLMIVVVDNRKGYR